MTLRKHARVWAFMLVCPAIMGSVIPCAPGVAHAQDDSGAEAQAERSGPGSTEAGDRSEGAEPVAERAARAPDPAVDGKVFDVGPLTLRYFREHPLHPTMGELAGLEVELGVTPEGLVAARDGVESRTFTIGELGDGAGRRVYASALTRVMERIASEFKARSIIGVFVAPDPNQLILREGGEDFREAGDASLVLVIYTARVTRVRSIASGTRIAQEERIDNTAHARILRRSPVQAHDEGEDESERRDLLLKDELDSYALRLNRHPGRRVDIAVAPSEGIGNAELQYLIQENKPWSAYFQVSNTGTASTDRWRERFGFQNTQLTNHDDVLLVEYITAGFSASHLVSLSYERPIRDSERWRWRVDANWNEFQASDVGILGERFTGDGWGVGAQVSWNAVQRQETFVDLIAGARFQHVQVTNPGILLGKGEEDLFLPRVGVRAERFAETTGLAASVMLEWTQSGVTAASQRDLERLGRIAPDLDSAVLRWDVEASAYLEPILDPAGWQDATTPKSSTLAHEVVATLKGQYAFNNRLIPQHEGVLGGLYTVRGYDESVVVGDTTIVVSAEYRFHVPRAFAVNPEPSTMIRGRPFKWAPQQVYGRPDWDLVLRAFVDAGWSWNSKALPFENNESMLGAGVGAELLILRNFSARLDWAMALRDLNNRAGDAGDSRFHFVLTLLF